jgi:histamine receptor H3
MNIERLNKTFGFEDKKSEINGDSSLKVIMFTFLSFIALVTIYGNLLVILCFLKYKKVRTINNYYILSLSIADFIIGILMPFYAHNISFNNGYWKFGEIFCRLWLLFDYVVGSASVLQIVLISFDRFVSVVYPLKYRKWPMKKIVCLNISIVWLLAFLNYGPAIVIWPHVSNKYTQIKPLNSTQLECKVEFSNNFYYLIITASIEFFIPFVTITAFNISIYLNIRRRILSANRAYKKLLQMKSIKKELTSSNIQLELISLSQDLYKTKSIKFLFIWLYFINFLLKI